MPVHSLTEQTRATFDLQRTGQYTLHLRADDQVFADRRTVLAARHVVRDNSDQEGVERQGAWNASRSVQLYNGANYESASTGSGARFTWHLAVPEGGRYQVQACWTSATDHATDAPYTISRDGVPLGTVRVDQTTSGGLWMDLAEFEFQAGQTCSVSLGSDAAGDVVIADAVRLWQVGP
jgi:hypothetical protein